MEVIPAIDILGGRCVRLYQGDYTRSQVFSENPIDMAKQWVDQGATRLHLVDLDGAKVGEPVNTKTIEAIIQAVSISV
ncbi:MAG TPA: 1-(5-phosphoribosyl)-5-((5-phosphoribosylamino)methylideneamino)imidazole-4-carboxamide isomerase, partial [Cyanobacteria bacterium UBA12227]|nr:1-(5-phosphoribosyl)-5-((5-phosphoribosylamino)methylideneamino)imidazole-4-carboxamide isomerase [Cyanobacteria bacterium UBA12227]